MAFFTDLHHLHCGNLTISVVWIATRLIRTGFHLRCQPLLTLAHYLASAACQDLSTTIEVKLLRIESLCALGRFEAALYHFYCVVSGKFLPNPADFIRTKVQSRPLPFNDSKALADKLNNQTLHHLCSLNVNQSPYTNVYGRELCYKISVAQSQILISIAELVNEVRIIMIQNAKVYERSFMLCKILNIISFNLDVLITVQQFLFNSNFIVTDIILF